jgi:hypothetical protein
MRTRKNVLLVCATDYSDTLGELPYILKQAGYHVSLLCGAAQRCFIGSHTDTWLRSSDEPGAMFAHFMDIYRTNPDAYDWIIIGDDLTLRMLDDAQLPETDKRRIGPIRDARWLHHLGTKTGSVAFWKAIGIPHPPSAICTNEAEAKRAAVTIGFPVLLKCDSVGAGRGVFMCHNEDEITRTIPRIKSDPFLVQKFINGSIYSAEPLYLDGMLQTYVAAELLRTRGRFGLSLRRQTMPKPELGKLLETIGRELGYHGFVNATFVRDPATGEWLMFEFDCRPNNWLVQAKRAGIDYVKSLKAWNAGAPIPWQEAIRNARTTMLSNFHREMDYYILLRFMKGFSYWLTNRNNCWASIPFHDPRLLYYRMRRLFNHAVSIMLDDAAQALMARAAAHRRKNP